MGKDNQLVEIVLDKRSLEGCLSGSIAERNRYINNLVNSTEDKKVVVTKEFRDGLYEAMIHPESQTSVTVDGWFTTTYLTLSQKLGIEYTPEELREILFKNHNIPLGVGLVLAKVVEMGARVEPEEIGRYLSIHDMEDVAKNNLFRGKTKYFLESKYATCLQEMESTKKQIIEKAKEFKARWQEYVRKSWFYRLSHKPPEDVIPWPLEHNLQMLQYDREVLSRCMEVLNRQVGV
ncbi:hypothetical protein FJZ19_01635 [Candidatus Pacearchaeota archaeon]|nr:hypothetical protein [Candidatus Pacearchaeota archaeon]